MLNFVYIFLLWMEKIVDFLKKFSSSEGEKKVKTKSTSKKKEQFSESVILRMSKSQKKQLQKMAQKLDIKMSELLRKVVADAVSDELDKQQTVEQQALSYSKIAAESAVQAVSLLAAKVNVQPDELETIKAQSKEQVSQELVQNLFRCNVK